MTSNHSIYSADRLDFVPAGELRVGDTLRNLHGDVRIESIEQLGTEERVYNLEIHGEHVFRVASSGVLVHNSSGSEGTVSGKPSIVGPVRPYDEATAARIPGYDNHHLDPKLGRIDPSYPKGPTIGVRNDNANGSMPGGVNLHTAKGGLQTSLNDHIKNDLGFTIKQWNELPDGTRQLHLRRYYASFGIPFPF